MDPIPPLRLKAETPSEPGPPEQTLQVILKRYLQDLLVRAFAGRPTQPDEWYLGFAIAVTLEAAHNNDVLKQRLAAIEADLIVIRADIKESKAIVKASKTDLDETKGNLGRTKIILDALRQELEQEKRMKNAYDAEIDKLTKANARLNEVNARLSDDNATLARKLGNVSPATSPVRDALTDVSESDPGREPVEVILVEK